MMGVSGDVLRHFNNFNLYQLGWLNTLAKVGFVEQAGTYNLTLRPPAFIDKGYHVVIIPLKNENGRDRRKRLSRVSPQISPFEFFTNDPVQNVTRGVSLRFAPTDTSTISPTYLLDYQRRSQNQYSVGSIVPLEDDPETPDTDESTGQYSVAQTSYTQLVEHLDNLIAVLDDLSRPTTPMKTS